MLCYTKKLKREDFIEINIPSTELPLIWVYFALVCVNYKHFIHFGSNSVSEQNKQLHITFM